MTDQTMAQRKQQLRTELRRKRVEHAGSLPPEVSALVFNRPPGAVLDLVPEGATIGLPPHEESIALAHRTRTIRARLQGDAVVAMDHFGADLTFFDPL